ncbi:hypothetical protein PVAND_003618 [Polypedilum vanderplanki]|uniref:PDZ domain-containing protein n=1 Tax=Polypedilum vanderplanki TaxID=319348 RepID=A0A9J6BUL5_POLVA|nr:hypothetical protein PVAND_003618 [Polypedilum vanderplanki]
MDCYSGGNIVSAVFGTIAIIAVLGVLAWWIYKKHYSKFQKDAKLVPNDPENAKHEFAFDNLAFKGDGSKPPPLNANWTSPKNASTINDYKRKPLDDSYAGMPAPRLVSLKGSDFTGLGIECYGGLKDGIFVKKVAPQGPASGQINIGDRITSLTIDFRHIVQEDAMTILSYASPYNVQIELINGNNKLRSSGSSSKGKNIDLTASPKPGRQSPLIHPLVRSSSQSDLNTIERNSRKKLFQNDDKDYPTLKMDKNDEAAIALAATLPMSEAHHFESEKKSSPSFMQQVKTRIAKIEEKFQTRSSEKSKLQQHDMVTTMNMEEGKVNETKAYEDDEAISPDIQSTLPTTEQSKKGLKFGIRVLPSNVNEKLFGKKNKTPSPPLPKMENDVKIDMDQIDGNGKMTTEVTIECESFNRQGSMQASIKRDANGIPQELPSYMANAANAAKEGRNKVGCDAEMRKSKGKAPRPPMVSVDLNESTQTMDTNLTISIADISSESAANNTNNVNMEIEDELDRITEKYLNQSKDKLNFTDNFASNNNDSSLLNNTDGSVTLFDKIEELKDDIDDVILRRKEPSNSSTPKCERKTETNDDSNNFTLNASNLDLSNYENCKELNSSDITVHQSNSTENDDVQNDETRRAASMGDLSLMKKSLTEKDSNSSTLERAQSLDITDNTDTLMPKQTLAMAFSKPTDDLTALNVESDPTVYNTEHAQVEVMMTTTNKTDQIKANFYEESDTNIPDDVKVIRYPLGTMEREPKSDVLKKILGSANMQKSDIENEITAPFNENIIDASDENVPMTKSTTALKSVVTIESSINETLSPMEALSIDTVEQQPISLTLINNTIDVNTTHDTNQMSPIFSSDTFGVNSIKISSIDVKPQISTASLSSSKTLINNGDGFYVKDNVVTISTDSHSQPSSIQFIDDVKLDFNMQVLDEFEKDEKTIIMKDDFKPKIVEAEIKEKLNGTHTDSEINNNVSKTNINHENDAQQQHQMNKFLTEIVFKGSDDSAIDEMTTSEETALTSSTMSNSSSESSCTSPPVLMTSTKTLTLTNVPLSTANFIKNERRHIEKNFVPHNNDIKFTSTVNENPSLNNSQTREPVKRLSQIEMIRQNFEKSTTQNASETSIPIPVARRISGIPVNIQKTTPSKIPILSHKKSSPTNRTNGNKTMKNSSDSVG